MSAIRIIPAMLLGLGLACAPAGTAQAEWRLFKKPQPAQTVQADPTRDGTVRTAQAGDSAVRILQLEEQVRELNGRVEDLTFQVLQMQEEFRRMQEDNELRFQELEGGSAAPRDNRVAGRENDGERQVRPAGRAPVPRSDQNDSIGRMIEGGTSGLEGTADSGAGLAPRTLGTLTFDENGNVVDSGVGNPIDLTGRGAPNAGSFGGDGDFPANPDALYDLGYGYVQAGEYAQAEQVFAEFVSRYPDNPRAAEARFWLGESLFAQGHYDEAARIFLDTHKQFPDGRMAPQTLLKLGVSLAGMNQRELACATFAEVPKKYPQMPNAVRAALESERQAASCLVN